MRGHSSSGRGAAYSRPGVTRGAFKGSDGGRKTGSLGSGGKVRGTAGAKTGAQKKGKGK